MRVVRRLGRVAIGSALSSAAIALVVGLLAQPVTAGATTLPTGAIHATSSPPVASTGTGVPAGSLTITLSAAGLLPTGGELSLFVTASSSGTIHWDVYTVSASSGISVTSTMHLGNALNIHLGPKTTTRAATVYVTGIKLTTTTAKGTIEVAASLTSITFSPSSATDGILVRTPPKAPAMSLKAVSQPTVKDGTSAVAAGDWTVRAPG